MPATSHSQGLTSFPVSAHERLLQTAAPGQKPSVGSAKLVAARLASYPAALNAAYDNVVLPTLERL